MAKPSQGIPGSKAATDSSADEGFLGRWSRRKAEAQIEDEVAHVDLKDEQVSDLSEPDSEHVDQPPGAVDPASLPDIDKMEAGSDFSVFMQAGVPQELKNKALRKLWRVKPELANLDGLIDYGEDLTGSFKVVDHLKTAYQVGKGFLANDEDQQPKAVSSETEDDVLDGQTIAKGEEKPDEIDLAAEDDQAEEDLVQKEKIAEKNFKS